MPRLLCILMLPLLLPACASVMVGTSQSVVVDVLNAPGARCRGTDMQGYLSVWTDTPSGATVQRGAGPLTLICERDGFTKTVMQVEEGTTGAVMGNVLFGLIGGPLGILIDIASGAAQEYPQQVRLVMEPVATAPQPVHDEYLARKEELDEEAKAAEAADGSSLDDEY